MNYATIKTYDIANGPGVRVSLFVSGCSHHCPGCFNREAWDYNYGEPFTDEVISHILAALEPDYIQGLTLLGGEPLDPANQEDVWRLVRAVRERFPNKDVWCYTGYLWEKDVRGWMREACPRISELVSMLDVLVDGPFILEKKNISLLFRGSENQRLIDVQRTLDKGNVVIWREDGKL